MGIYTLFVMAEPTPGMEAEFNDWYTNQHVGDVLTTPGFLNARRLKLCDGYESDLRYAVLYEIETDDPHGAVATVNARAEQEWGPHPAFGKARIMLYENITPLIHAK